MGISMSGRNFILDKESEDKIVEIATQALKDNHKSEYAELLEKYRRIVFIQEVASFQKYLECRHPEQVDQIFHLKAILNHERAS